MAGFKLFGPGPQDFSVTGRCFQNTGMWTILNYDSCFFPGCPTVWHLFFSTSLFVPSSFGTSSPCPKNPDSPSKMGLFSMTWTRHAVRWFLCWTVEWFELNGLPHDLGCQMTWNSKCAQNGREIIKLRTWNDWQMFETSEEMRRGEMVEMMISDFTGWKAEHKWLISELSPKCCDATS